jgi:hypothetical protein
MVRLWNVSIRSAGQQPSRAEYGKWKVDIAELFAKVTLWRDRPESFFRQEIWASYIRFVATLLLYIILTYMSQHLVFGSMWVSLFQSASFS